jgi:prefoldin subunit 5
MSRRLPFILYRSKSYRDEFYISRNTTDAIEDLKKLEHWIGAYKTPEEAAAYAIQTLNREKKIIDDRIKSVRAQCDTMRAEMNRRSKKP